MDSKASYGWMHRVAIRASRYVVSGGFAAIAAYATGLVVRDAFLWNDAIAQGIGFVVGTLVNYPISRQWVFVNRSRKVPLQVGIFAAIGLMGLGVNEAALALLVAQLHLPFALASAGGLASAFLWNFTMHNTVTFGWLR